MLGGEVADLDIALDGALAAVLESDVDLDMDGLGAAVERIDEDLLWERNKRWHKKMYEHGWVGLNWPKEYGGRGATFIEQVIFQQELGRLGLPMGINVLGIIMTGPALMQWGTEEQKARYLKPILTADEIWCEGMSEPGAGSDLASIQTRAELHGDEFIVKFGSFEGAGTTALTAAESAGVGTRKASDGPVVIAPGSSYTFTLWGLASAAAINPDFQIWMAAF